MNYRNLSSHIDMHTHAGSAFDNCVTLTFALRVNACRGPAVHDVLICRLSLVLIAQVVFILEREHTQTYRHTKSQMLLITLPTYRLPAMWVTRRSQPADTA